MIERLYSNTNRDFREAVIELLIALPQEIRVAEEKVLVTQLRLADAKNELATKETELLLAVDDQGKPLIDGKNAEVRAAQIRQLTRSERESIASLERELMCLRLELSHLQTEFSALREIARLAVFGVASSQKKTEGDLLDTFAPRRDWQF